MQPRNFVISEGILDTIHKSPSSGTASKHNKNVRTAISASGPGNVKVAGEGSYSEWRNSSRGVSDKRFSYMKEGCEKTSGNNFEKTQCIHPFTSTSKWKVYIV